MIHSPLLRMAGKANEGNVSGELPDEDALTIDYMAWDDAWYDVELHLRGEVLTVEFCNLDPPVRERFSSGMFRDYAELELFRKKFRRNSSQLQDGECQRVREGMMVCGSISSREGDLRFYDAKVLEVCPSEHKVVDGEEECLCKFVLFWQHGPNAGSTTCTDVANICLLRQGNAQIHPLLDAFVNISRKKIDQKMKSTNLLSVSSGRGVVSHGSLPAVVGEDLVDGDSYGRPLEMEKLANVGSETENIVSGPEMVTKWHYFIIDSLDLELSPADIVGFIYHHTSILCKVFFAPMLPTEYYARGIVFLEGEGNLGKLSSFLEDPSQIIISSTGRPWLIVEHSSGTLDTISGCLGLNLKEINAEQQWRHLPKNLKVVRKGTLEYAAGFRRKKILIEFQNDLEGRLKNLEERMFGN